MSSKLPILKAKDLIRVLNQEGFILIRQKGSHATFKNSSTQKIVTVPIHPGQDLKRGLLRGILNDLNMSQDEFLAKLHS